MERQDGFSWPDEGVEQIPQSVVKDNDDQGHLWAGPVSTLHLHEVQYKAVTFGPIISGLYRQVDAQLRSLYKIITLFVICFNLTFIQRWIPITGECLVVKKGLEIHKIDLP